jgi:hypothetical protein
VSDVSDFVAIIPHFTALRKLNIRVHNANVDFWKATPTGLLIDGASSYQLPAPFKALAILYLGSVDRDLSYCAVLGLFWLPSLKALKLMNVREPVPGAWSSEKDQRTISAYGTSPVVDFDLEDSTLSLSLAQHMLLLPRALATLHYDNEPLQVDGVIPAGYGADLPMLQAAARPPPRKSQRRQHTKR